MKTTTLKAFLIMGGSMLIGTETMNASVTDQFGHFVSNELSHFHFQALYVILGVIAAGLAFYFLSNKLNKEEKTFNHKINYPQPRRQHHRSVVKKTS